MNKLRNIHFFIFPVLMALCVMSIPLYRSLWFDEALTLMNFVSGKSLSEIYHNYIIPNNQIIYSMSLALWTNITNSLAVNYDFASRLLSVLFSVIAVIALYCGFKRETGGKWGMFFIITSAYLSVPFIIYGTAVRGYQLSFMLLVFLAWSIKNVSRKVTWKNISAYALLSLLLVGTIPTNLLGIGMAVGLFLPELWGKWKRIAALAVIPFIMFFAFYLPIWDKFLQVCRLGEGLHDRFSAIIVPYVAFLLNYSIIAIIGIWGWILACKKRKIHYLNLFRILAVLLWIIPCLFLQVAPFYRVFYPCFALLLIMTGFGVKHWIYLFFCKLSDNRQHIAVLIFGILAFNNFFLLKSDFAAQKIQKILNITTQTDDYFQPYYFHKDFYPPAIINKINNQYINKVNLVFLTFEADSRALYFYATYGGKDNSKYLLDGPKFRVPMLPYRSLIVLPENSDMNKYIKRFKLENRRISKLFCDGKHEVWEVL